MNPVAPVIASATFDQPSYITGETITLTVDYTPGESVVAQTVNITGTDTVTGLPGSISGTINLMTADPTTWAVTDSKGRTYALKSDNGSVAVFTTVA